MKKIISLLLCMIMTLGLLAGCAAGGQKTPKAFSVGYAKADITPTESVPLRGYGDAMERFSTGTLEPMYATCVAFADTEGNKVLLISHDLTNSPASLCDDCRAQISEATGIPVSNILFTASHSHSAPDYSQNVPTITNYMKLFTESVLQGAQDAVADLAPATMETGFSRVDRVNSVRHYLLADGSYQGKGIGGLSKDKLIGHATKVDNLLQVVKFTREGDKKDVLLVNWCGHPMGVDDSIYYCAGPNYIGVLRMALEEKYDCEVSYVLGGSGNVNNNSKIPGEIDQKSYIELGNRLADEVSDILENKLTPSKLDKIYLSENLWVTKNKNGQDQALPLYAFSIGDWACVTAPFEIFDTNTMAVRDASKFKMTFYATCANEANGYLPTPASYGWKITYEAQITKFPMGTAELLQEQLIMQLDQIFAAGGYEIVDKGEGYNTPVFVPATDDVIYTNPVPGDMSKINAVQNGFYAMILMNGAQAKNILCIDQATAEKVAAQTNMKLVFNESNVVVDVIPQ